MEVNAMLLVVLDDVVLNRQIVTLVSTNAVLSAAGAVACELREIAVRTANAVVTRNANLVVGERHVRAVGKVDTIRIKAHQA